MTHELLPSGYFAGSESGDIYKQSYSEDGQLLMDVGVAETSHARRRSSHDLYNTGLPLYRGMSPGSAAIQSLSMARERVARASPRGLPPDQLASRTFSKNTLICVILENHNDFFFHFFPKSLKIPLFVGKNTGIRRVSRRGYRDFFFVFKND